jgi:hypothetical protein
MNWVTTVTLGEGVIRRRGGTRTRMLGTGLALAALLLGFTPPVHPEAAPGRAAEAAPVMDEGARDDGRRTIRRLPANLGRGIVGVFHADNVVPFLVGGSAAATASFFDQDVRDSIQGETLNWGDMLDASIVNFGYTELIKVAVGRERPNGQDNKSFPSGHTSNSFALAAVAERHYGWKLGVPAYLVAGLVGASRLEQDKHYLSDVVAGAALGYIVGRTVVRVNGRPLSSGSARGAEMHLAPIVARHTRGVRLSIVF